MLYVLYTQIVWQDVYLLKYSEMLFPHLLSPMQMFQWKTSYSFLKRVIYIYQQIYTNRFKQLWLSMLNNFFTLKQQNRYLSVIIVCGYFSFIRSFTCLNFPSKSNSYHNTSLSMSFGCWHLSGIPLCPLHCTVYTIAWQRKFEPKWIFNINFCILSG